MHTLMGLKYQVVSHRASIPSSNVDSMEDVLKYIKETLPDLPIEEAYSIELFGGTGALLELHKNAEAVKQIVAKKVYVVEDEANFTASSKLVKFGDLRIKYAPYFDSILLDDRKYKALPVSSYTILIYNGDTPMYSIIPVLTI